MNPQDPYRIEIRDKIIDLSHIPVGSRVAGENERLSAITEILGDMRRYEGHMSASTKMLAARLIAPHTIRLDQVPRREPGPSEVRIRLEGCGVCASNLASWEGMPWTRYPMAPGALGHEGWGRIDALGTRVGGIAPELHVGDRVAALSYHAYAEYDFANADAVVKLPPSLDEMPFPGEPLGCAMNIFYRSGIRAGNTVAIVGVGFLGALLIRLAVNAHARVIAISRRSFSLGIARAMGASLAIPMEDHGKVIEAVGRATDGKFCDVVIEAVGKQWPLDLAAEITRERGRLVIAGYHQDGPRQVNMQLWNWRGLDVVNAHERDPKVYLEGIRAAIDAVVNGAIDPRPLFTHSFGLDRIADALDATRDRPEGFLKALVMYE